MCLRRFVAGFGWLYWRTRHWPSLFGWVCTQSKCVFLIYNEINFEIGWDLLLLLTLSRGRQGNIIHCLITSDINHFHNCPLLSCSRFNAVILTLDLLYRQLI